MEKQSRIKKYIVIITRARRGEKEEENYGEIDRRRGGNERGGRGRKRA